MDESLEKLALTSFYNEEFEQAYKLNELYLKNDISRRERIITNHFSAIIAQRLSRFVLAIDKIETAINLSLIENNFLYADLQYILVSTYLKLNVNSSLILKEINKLENYMIEVFGFEEYIQKEIIFMKIEAYCQNYIIDRERIKELFLSLLEVISETKDRIPHIIQFCFFLINSLSNSCSDIDPEFELYIDELMKCGNENQDEYLNFGLKLLLIKYKKLDNNYSEIIDIARGLRLDIQNLSDDIKNFSDYHDLLREYYTIYSEALYINYCIENDLLLKNEVREVLNIAITEWDQAILELQANNNSDYIKLKSFIYFGLIIQLNLLEVDIIEKNESHFVFLFNKFYSTIFTYLLRIDQEPVILHYKMMIYRHIDSDFFKNINKENSNFKLN